MQETPAQGKTGLQLTPAQLDMVGQYVASGMIFVGMFRGYGDRSTTFDVKDKKTGKATGEKETKIFRELAVEVRPLQDGKPGRPVSKIVAMDYPRGEGIPPWTIPDDTLVLVCVKSLKKDDYTGEYKANSSLVLPLPAADAPPPKPYTLKDKEGAKA